MMVPATGKVFITLSPMARAEFDRMGTRQREKILEALKERGQEILNYERDHAEDEGEG